MQFSALLLTAFATAVFAQDLSGLPACAQPCFTNNLSSSSCASTDLTCLCKDKTFFNLVEVCVLADCTAITDVYATLTWATTTCAAAGVTLKKRDVSPAVFGRRH